jgi:hypothetical protein
MRVCHDFTVRFDDPNLVSCAGLGPVLQLAERAGFQELVAEHVRIGKPGGVNPDLKIGSLVAGMLVELPDSWRCDPALIRGDERHPESLKPISRLRTFAAQPARRSPPTGGTMR